MKTYPDLYILRHGQTEWNATGRLQGHYDSALTALGTAQATAQHDILRQRDLTGFRAFSSPQGRAFRTAGIALSGLIANITTDEALSEIGLGEWAGAEREPLMTAHGTRDGFALYELAPNGEGFAALQARCAVFLDRLQGPAVLVTHGITSRMIRLILSDQPLSYLPEIGGGQGVVYYFAQGSRKQMKFQA